MDKYQELLLYRQVMQNDVELTYGKVTLADLRHYNNLKFVGNRPYQVHCDSNECKFSDLFTDLDKAIMKFIEIKHKLKNAVVRKRNFQLKDKSSPY